MKNTMKKLMIATLGLAVAGSVFGTPEVFDYKASVKHMYLKEVKVKVKSGDFVVYQKYAKSASLKGYLIMDREGVTSPTITADEPTPSTAKAFDYGRNRGFLVVQNSKAEAKVRAPKILPAVLDAKWVDTQFKKDHEAKSGLAEGTLFVGGDSVACVRTQLDVVKDPADGVYKVMARTAAPVAPAENTPGMSAYADYVWTSIYLFGQFNGPNWFNVRGVSPFGDFESKWDAKLPTDLQIGWGSRSPVNYFHDTWMNGAGIGKFAQPESGDLCCGLQKTSAYVLASLSGNLKGGLFLCTENGIDAENTAYKWFDGYAWEDQFNCARLDIADTFSPDSWQNDMWNDGAVEQETTDVLFGSWSIKRSNKFFPSNTNKDGFERYLTDAEERLIMPAAGTGSLWAAIKGAALKLKNSANVYNGKEIYATSASKRFDLPMVTPQFATYYGLK